MPCIVFTILVTSLLHMYRLKCFSSKARMVDWCFVLRLLTPLVAVNIHTWTARGRLSEIMAPGDLVYRIYSLVDVWGELWEPGSDVITAHLNCLITLVRLTSVMRQHPPSPLLLLLLVVLTRNATIARVRSDGSVVVELLTFGQELTSICVVPRAS